MGLFVKAGESVTPERRLADLVFGFDTTLEGEKSLQEKILWHIREAINQEREVCALIAEGLENAYCDGDGRTCKHSHGEHIAEAIRARSKEQ